MTLSVTDVKVSGILLRNFIDARPGLAQVLVDDSQFCPLCGGSEPPPELPGECDNPKCPAYAT